MARILLAEDDTSLRGFVTGALEKAGHVVVPCVDGLEALEAHRKDPTLYDLLLTDIVMPGMDGIELSTIVKEIQPAIKIMFITGFAGMAVEDGANTPVVSKPFHLGDLVKAVNELFLSQ